LNYIEIVQEWNLEVFYHFGYCCFRKKLIRFFLIECFGGKTIFDAAIVCMQQAFMKGHIGRWMEFASLPRNRIASKMLQNCQNSLLQT
jgi:hypothetical protein